MWLAAMKEPLATKQPAAKKEPVATKKPAAKKEPVVAIKKDTAQVSCRHR